MTQTQAEQPTIPTPYWPEGIPRHLDVPRTSLYHNLEVSAARYPDKTALWFYGHEVSFKQLLNEVAHLSGHLQRQGVRQGDRVLVWMQNSPQFVAAIHAVWRCGAVVVPLSPMLTPEELMFFLDNADISVGLVGAELYPKARAAKLGHAVVAGYGAGVTDSPVPVPEALAVPEQAEDGDVTYAQAISGEPGEVVPVGADDLAVMPYTSGTTGRPKGCMHTHSTVQANATGASAWARVTSGDVALGTLPFFHVTGLTCTLLASIYSATKLIVMNRWDRAVATKLIRDHQVTLWVNVATMVIDLLANPDLKAEDLRSLRILNGGGMALPQAVGARLEAMTGIKFVEGYGLSETIAQTHTNPVERPKFQCLGVPVFGVDARIIDPETLQELPAGSNGEIVVSGPQVMRGYWKRPEATDEAFFERDGRRFLRTGDLGHRDEEGYFFMVDRLKRMVNVSGMKVWPSEVETTLFKHPAVQEACVIGVPDERTGERARALIVLKPGQSASGDDIALWARDHLAPYKIPRDWQFVDSLPRGGTGKVNWRALQEQARAEMTGA